MASQTTSIAPRSSRVHPSLTDLLDAYEAFCNHGSLRVSWRNLSVFLTHYLRHYYKVEGNTLPIRKKSPRSAFLAQLPMDEFGYVLCEVVYLLLRQIPTTPLDTSLIPWRFRVLELHTADENGRMLDLLAPELHELLLDVTAQLDLATNPHSPGRELSCVNKDWKATASHPTSVYTTELLPQKSSSIGNVSRPSFLEASRNLLRRALSSGSRAHSRTQVLDRRRIGRPVTLSHEPMSTGFDTAEKVSNEPRQSGERLPTYDEAVALQLRHSSHQRLEPTIRIPLSAVAEESGTNMRPSKKSSVADSREATAETARIQRVNTVTSVTSKSITEDGTNKRLSVSSGYDSFVPAENHKTVTVSNRVSFSRPGSIATFLTITTATIEFPSVHHESQQNHLKANDQSLETLMEMDWSGRGQHVEYGQEEADTIPLHHELLLDRKRNTIVESVRCKRVRMVRKTLRCTKQTSLKREDVVREVQHMYRVQHSHIVRLVGTYAIGSEVSILTYPYAEWNLETFLQTTPIADDVDARCESLLQFFTCLSKVLDYIHSFPLNHMDIKPKNLLVRDIRHSAINASDPFKIYITDFAISRAFASSEEDMEIPSSFSRPYAAMEVVLQDATGLPADVFSLGCVYAEMLATVLDCSLPLQKHSHWEQLHSARGKTENGIRPYYMAVDNVRNWVAGLYTVDQPELEAVRKWTHQMLDSDPEKRPAARQVANDPHLPFSCLNCSLCMGPEDFEAARPLHADIHIP